MHVNPEIVNLLVQYSWLGIFAFYWFFDFFIPIPEEFSIITFAYIFTSSATDSVWGWVLIVVAVLIRNALLFFISKARPSWASRFTKNKKGRLEELKLKLEYKLTKTLIILNIVPKIRLAIPIFAGLSNVSGRRFIRIQSIILVIYVSVNYALGMLFYGTLARVFKSIDNFRNSEYFIGFIILSTIISIILGRYLVKKYYR